MNICNFCKKEFSNKGALSTHEPYCKENPNRSDRIISPKAGRKKGTPAWNVGISLPDEYRNKISESLKGKSKGIGLTEESEDLRKRKIKETIEKNKLNGGNRRGSGRGIKGWYKGFWCDSTWELAWVIFNIDHEIKFERNHTGFIYIYGGKQHLYFPDFKIEDSYVEIKGRRSYKDLDELTKEKINQFTGSLKVLMEDDMKTFLEYARNKHGINFHKMYE